MKRFIGNMQRAANQFNVVDFAIFKVYLCAVGILLGAYFAPFWLARINMIWAVAIVGGIITLIELIRYALRP